MWEQTNRVSILVDCSSSLMGELEVGVYLSVEMQKQIRKDNN